MQLQPDRQLANFRIVDTFGEGGMGEVYRATDTKLERDVAIKLRNGPNANNPLCYVNRIPPTDSPESR